MCSVQQICFLAFAAAAAAGSSLAGQCDSELSDSAALLQTNIAGRPEAGEDRGPAEEDSALASKMQWDDQHCACTTVFLAAVLDTGTNAVHHEDHRMGGFSFFQRYYESIIALPGGRAKAVIIHNRLPENLTRAKSNSAVSFTKVDISGMHEHMTVVEWRWNPRALRLGSGRLVLGPAEGPCRRPLQGAALRGRDHVAALPVLPRPAGAIALGLWLDLALSRGPAAARALGGRAPRPAAARPGAPRRSGLDGRRAGAIYPPPQASRPLKGGSQRRGCERARARAHARQ